MHYVRVHGGVENCLDWTLDTAFEDQHRLRMGNVDQNVAMVGHIILNLLKAKRATRAGIKIKRQMADWDNGYLLKVLQRF
jgi:predicted transposase YbfD/YdcC